MSQKLRSLFFILPQREDVFDKLDSFPRPDCYIFDIENGVPSDEKQKTRENIKKYAKKLKAMARKF